MEIRPYDSDRDREDLWRCKRAFELELGGADPEKRAAYEGKVTDEYRQRYLDWVDRCVADDPRCVTVADPDPDGGEGDRPGAEPDPGDGTPTEDGEGTADEPREGAPTEDGVGAVKEPGEGIAGYVFVLPERLAMVWDAAVVNEVYVAEPYRGTGVADDLMAAALALARDQEPPLSRVVLDVDRENERARRFYDRHGFAHWGEMVAREL